MDMVFADHSFQNLNIQHIARLAQQLPAAQLNIARQHLIPIFSAAQAALSKPKKLML